MLDVMPSGTPAVHSSQARSRAGAAALGPSSLSLIIASHTDAAQRTRALAWWGVTASSAGAVGVVLGGVLTASLGWRWVFFVNIPLGAGLLAAAAGCLAASPAAADRPRLDVPGAVTVTAAVGALVYGVSRTPAAGWTSAGTLAAIGAGLVLLAAFAVIEVRTRESLIPLGLFSVPNVRIGNVLIVCLGVAITAPLFFLSLYLQQGLGDSALRAGLALLPMATVLSLGVIVSRRLMPLLGPGRLLTAGALVAAGGLAWLAWLPAHPAYLSHVLAPTMVAGCGMSVTLLPVTAAATTGVAPANTGVASGLFNMARQIGGAVGLAVLVTIASRSPGTATPAAPGGSSTATTSRSWSSPPSSSPRPRSRPGCGPSRRPQRAKRPRAGELAERPQGGDDHNHHTSRRRRCAPPRCPANAQSAVVVPMPMPNPAASSAKGSPLRR